MYNGAAEDPFILNFNWLTVPQPPFLPLYLYLQLPGKFNLGCCSQKHQKLQHKNLHLMRKYTFWFEYLKYVCSCRWTQNWMVIDGPGETAAFNIVAVIDRGNKDSLWILHLEDPWVGGSSKSTWGPLGGTLLSDFWDNFIRFTKSFWETICQALEQRSLLIIFFLCDK